MDETIDSGFLDHAPDRLIGDRAYDNGPVSKVPARIWVQRVATQRTHVDRKDHRGVSKPGDSETTSHMGEAACRPWATGRK